MSDCIHCGETLDDGAKFCGSCGAPVADKTAVDGEPEPTGKATVSAVGPTASPPPPTSSTSPVWDKTRFLVIASAGAAFILGGAILLTGSPDEEPQSVANRPAVAEPEPLPASPSQSTAATTQTGNASPNDWKVVETTFGRIDDRSSTASLCPKQAPCTRAHNRTLLFGDRIEAPRLTVIDFEAPDGDISRHGLEGNISNVEFYDTPEGRKLAIYLEAGRIAGDVRGLTHIIHAGGGFCVITDASYSVERSRTGGRVVIEQGSVTCVVNGSRFALTRSNPTVTW